MSGKGSGSNKSAGNNSKSGGKSAGQHRSTGNITEPQIVSGWQYYDKYSQQGSGGGRYVYIGKDSTGEPEFIDYGPKGRYISSAGNTEPQIVSGWQYYDKYSQGSEGGRYVYIGKDSTGEPEFIDHGPKGGRLLDGPFVPLG